MNRFFGAEPALAPFRAFSGVHLIVLALLIAVNYLLLRYMAGRRSERARKAFRVSAATALLFLELLEQGWKAGAGVWAFDTSLPLHLCRVSAFIVAFLLLTGNRYLYEIGYFWGIAGAANAIITPTLGAHGFPHLLFFKFFLSHGLIVLSMLYLTLIEGYRPTGRSILRIAVITNIYAGLVAVIDYLLGANYLYLCENPGGSTALAPFGPWPRYLPALWIIGTIAVLLLYLPFAVRDIRGRRKE